MTKTEMIRAAKAMQTETRTQQLVLTGLSSINHNDELSGVDQSALAEQIVDALTTSQNHIDALQHVIDELTKPGEAGR